jgi:tetratricopeptide (TPR) repeat protein
MLFLKPDGSELDRIVGYKTSKEFLSQAQDALAGKNAVARAKEKLAGHEKDPQARSGYADELARAGRYEEALAEYLWCFDEGHKADPSYSGVRASFLLRDITMLGKSHPPAIKALEDRRDAAESRVVDGSGSDDDLGDAVSLNRALNARGRTLALYERAKKQGPLTPVMKRRFSRELLAPLVESRRYQDALDLFGDPEGFVTGKIERFDQTSKMDEGRGEEVRAAMQEAQAYVRSQIVSECGSMYEALLGIGKTELAAKVAARLIGFAPTGKTYAVLVDRASRAEAVDVARELAAAGLEKLPESERAEVRSAQERIPASK